MGRAPCCEKMGLKRGPWTPEEDKILVAHIHSHGHGNWRALPKQAGLLRCGKSCRLRWINYLRPDIKRGNFTDEEEQSIIQLHQLLGNRCLPLLLASFLLLLLLHHISTVPLLLKRGQSLPLLASIAKQRRGLLLLYIIPLFSLFLRGGKKKKNIMLLPSIAGPARSKE